MANESALSNSIASGRTGVVTNTTEYGVLLAGTTATNPIQNAGAGTATQILTSNGAAANPSFKAYPGSIAATQANQETGTATDVYVTPGRQQYHISAAKAWVRWYVDTGTPTVSSNYNVSSLTDGGAGVTTVNFTTNFSGTGYAAVSIGSINASNALQTRVGTLPAVGSCVFYNQSCDTGFGTADPSTGQYVGVACFGDQ